MITLVSYVVNFIHDKTMYDITLNFSDRTSYTVTINFPDVTNAQELHDEILRFAEQHIAEMKPHPLDHVVGQERQV